jgi:hypothetical protein
MFIDDLLFQLRRLKEPPNTVEGLEIAVRFQVDNVARYICGDRNPDGKRRPFHIEDQIPNVAPLAPVMWFEYNAAAAGQDPADHCGCLLSIDYDRIEDRRARKYIGLEIPEEVCWILRAEYFYSSHKPVLAAYASDWIYYIKVGSEGQTLGAFEMASQNIGPDTPQEYTPDESQRHVWHEEVVIALAAICFAHCKGAVIRENATSRQARRAAERAKKPVVTFRTIDIQPATRVLQEEGHISMNGLARALHICRGHFAHYTAERPLFGKYTGTFYRPMHLRGRADQGIVIKDYRVHPDTD